MTHEEVHERKQRLVHEILRTRRELAWKEGSQTLSLLLF